MPEITTTDIIIRLLVAFVLSAVIGLEREWYRKPAGLRTIVLIGVGSALFALVSFRIQQIFPRAISDPARIAAQIVTGVGFFGAGAIIRARGRVVGLTTAASIFVVAAVGMASAFGLFLEAIAVTILSLFTFYVLSFIVAAVRKRSKIPLPLEEEEEESDLVMH